MTLSIAASSVGLFDRLADVKIGSGIEAPAHVGLQRRGGERDDRHSRAAVVPLALPDDAYRLQTVHHRHLDVHQDQVVLLRFRLLDRDQAVLRFVDSRARALEIGANKNAIVPGIFGQQDAQRTLPADAGGANRMEQRAARRGRSGNRRCAELSRPRSPRTARAGARASPGRRRARACRRGRVLS